MGRSASAHRHALALSFLLIPILITSTVAQGLQTSPYSAANEVRRGSSPGGLDLAPSNPLGLPGGSLLGPRGSDTIPISSGMFQGILPRIPNLELGFLYSFGSNVRMGRLSADYVLPFSISPDSVIFGEAHGEWEDFWRSPKVSVTAAPGNTVTTSGTSSRVDLSFGGGYRTILRESTLVGVNGFYDSSRIFNKWCSSGGVGLEMAAIVGGDAAVDLNVNWYGNLFSRDAIINAFRNKGSSYDIEAGYSQSLFNQALDLRLKATGYQFDMGSAVYGWRTGAELTTRDGVFSLKYEYGHDGVNGSYNTVGGSVNVGFQPQNLLRWENPFMAPEPVFQSPRNLRRLLTQKVKRDWHQPAAVVAAKSAPAGGPWFRFTISGPQPDSIIRSHSWGKTDTYIYGTPGYVWCPIAIVASTFSIRIEGYESAGPTNVRMTLTSSNSVPGGCRAFRLVTPGGVIQNWGGGVTTVTFTIPAGGSLVYSFGPVTFFTDYAVPCVCAAPITPDAEAATLLIEDLGGNVPPQTIHVITVP